MVFNKKSKKYLKKYRKKTKKFKNKRKRQLKGGLNCLSYIITGAHGFIIYDKEDYLTLPNNVRLIVYSDFCGKACNTIKSIQRYICDEDRNEVNEIGYSIINPGSKIPELYAIPDKNANILINDCERKIVFKETYKNDKYLDRAVSLSEMISKLEKYLETNDLKNSNIDLHWTLCLDSYDKEKIKLEDKNNKILNKNKTEYKLDDIYDILKYRMIDCDEENLGIEKNNDSNFYKCELHVKKNTLEVLSKNIKNRNVKIYLTYPKIIKKQFTLPNLSIKLTNNLFTFQRIIEDKIEFDKVNPEFKDYVEKNIDKYISLSILPSIEELFDKNIEYIFDGNSIIINIDLEEINGLNINDIVKNVILYSIINIPIYYSFL